MRSRSLLPVAVLLISALLATPPQSSRAQLNVNSDRWMQDSDRAKLESKERDLLRQYEELDRASEQIVNTINDLSKKLTEVDIAKKSVRAELNSVRLKLL